MWPLTLEDLQRLPDRGDRRHQRAIAFEQLSDDLTHAGMVVYEKNPHAIERTNAVRSVRLAHGSLRTAHPSAGFRTARTTASGP